MVTISSFHNHYNRNPVNFIFIKFEKFVKVNLNDCSVILTNKDLVSNFQLFQIFKLSLLCTEDTSNIQETVVFDETVLGISTQWYWKKTQFRKYYSFIELFNTNKRNPLNAQEPKRSSSAKKIRKFNKLFNSYIANKIKDPTELIREYFSHELLELFDYFRKYIDYNKNNPRIQLLSAIRHNYGKDVYSSIHKYMN